MTDPWLSGVGRIRREAFVLHIGDTTYDVDDLRSHYVHYNVVRPALEKLNPPPTAAEILWWANAFAQFFHADPKGYREAMDILMAIVKES